MTVAQQNKSLAWGQVVGQSSGERISAEAIRDAARNTMQGNDYRRVRRRLQQTVDNRQHDSVSSGFLSGALETVAQSIGRFMKWLFSPFTGGGRRTRMRRPRPANTQPTNAGSSIDFISLMLNIILYLGLAILVVLVIWIIAFLIRQRNPNRSINSDGLFEEELIENLSAPPGEQAASTYESRAIRYAAEQNYRIAIRELLIGSMSWIERAGLIRFRKGLTNRDYLRAVWKKNPHRKAYAKTASAFERVYFGRRPATQEMFDQCLTVFQEAFREETATSVS